MKKFLKLTATAVSLVMALALMSCDNGNGTTEGETLNLVGNYSISSIEEKHVSDSQNISINSYGVSILPVIDYKLTDTWSACAALNFASIGYMHSTSDQSGSPSSDEFGLRTGNGSLFNVGLVYHF